MFLDPMNSTSFEAVTPRPVCPELQPNTFSNNTWGNFTVLEEMNLICDPDLACYFNKTICGVFLFIVILLITAGLFFLIFGIATISDIMNYLLFSLRLAIRRWRRSEYEKIGEETDSTIPDRPESPDYACLTFLSSRNNR